MPTNDYSKNIVYLSKEQYQELITNETLTVNGQTITYNDNDIYVTPQAEPITDVKINGTSIGSNGVANIPIANSNQFGLVKVENSTVNDAFSNGGTIVLNNILYTVGAASSKIKQGVDQSALISAAKMAEASFYGLSKVAGVDLKNETVTLGIYPDSSKAAIQNMLGITDLISTEESSTATAAHALNSTFMMDSKLHRATAAIAIGDAVEVGTNCEVVKADEVFVKSTDIATSTAAGLVKVDTAYGMSMSNGYIWTVGANASTIQAGESYRNPVMPQGQHISTFYGLSKVAGVDLKNETVTLGTYPETSKTAIRSLIGAAAASDIPSVPVQDVQVNGTSVVTDGVANVPIASSNVAGAVKIGDGLQINSNGSLMTNKAYQNTIQDGNDNYRPIVPDMQHISVFYGLSKVAGVNLKNVPTTLGVYSEASKSAISQMLNAPVSVSGTTPSITALAGVRYVCGEVSTLDITLPASGCIDVTFTSGATATVLTITPPTGVTVKWANGFDPTSLDANTTYEVNICDGLGVAVSWT